MPRSTLFQKNGSVFIRYLASFLTIAIFGCATIGLTLFALSTSELDKVTENEIKRHVQDITDDLYRQIELMNNIALKISFQPEFKYTYVEKSKYRDIELLEKLRNYQDQVLLSDSTFLMYEGIENLYSVPDKVTSKFSVYAKTYLGCKDQTTINDLYDRITTTETGDFITCDNDYCIYCVPVKNTGSEGRRLWICYLISNNSILNRASLTGGEVGEKIRLTWKNTPIVNSGNNDEVYASYTDERGLTVEYLSTEKLPYNRISTFTELFWIIIAAVLLFTCLLAWIAAKRNYSPIKELVNEFSDYKQGGRNEFLLLQDFLTRTIENNRISQERLYSNIEWLRSQRRKNTEQMLLLALSGKLSEKISRTDEELFFADEKKYAIICVAIDNTYDSNVVFERVNELGDRKTEICCIRLPFESMIAIGISCFDQEDYHNAVTMLGELFDVCELKAKMGAGSLVDEPDSIPDSLADALLNLNVQISSSSDTTRGNWYDESLIDMLCSHAYEGRKEEVHQVLDAIFAQIDGGNQSILIRSCAYSNVMNDIIRAATQSGMDLSTNQLSIVLLYNHPQKIKDLISALLDEICNRNNTKKDEQWNERKEKLFQYIHENFCKYDLCLAELEEKTGLTVRQIEQHMRDEMHKTFKEYLTELRMEEAKRLLQKGMSVNDTSNTVCYMSVSFFIKTFKKYVGMTPAEYRRNKSV